MEFKPGSTGTTVLGELPAPAPQAYEFGPYRLELPTQQLLRNGEPVALTPKAFHTLLTLIERRDRVVDKAELMRVVWPDSFVEEANLTQTIFVLRRTLGESPNGKPFIDTMPRRGYRFIADVHVEMAKPPVAADKPVVGRAHRYWIAAALVAVTGLLWFGISWTRGGPMLPGAFSRWSFSRSAISQATTNRTLWPTA